MPYFPANAPRLRIDATAVAPDKLRRAQLGAIWGLGSHFARSEAPAQIVLPTGVGKTAVMTVAPFLAPSTRSLVIAPSRFVRDQLATAFRTLGDMRASGVVPDDLDSPEVVVQKSRADESDWDRWRSADIVVGTVNVLSHGFPDVTRIPPGIFDLLIFDEAHHLPATAWTAILDAVPAPSALFTATPFRRDQQRLPGEIAFSYSLRRAIDDGVFAPVTFVPVDVPHNADKDSALAQAAVNRLRSQEHSAAGSRILVRTATVDDARHLVSLYADLGVALDLVDASTSPRAFARTISSLNSGEKLGIACVGALIEGFDFPQLKIAAYHAPHRTLAPTLQFIGRLARTGGGVSGELLATRGDVTDETRELYREDQAWEKLLPDIVDAAVEQERRLRRYVHEARQDGTPEIAPLAFTPPKSVHIYRTNGLVIDLDVSPSSIAGSDVVYRFFNAATNLLALVTRRIQHPRWLRTDALDFMSHALHLATWVENRAILFITTDSPPALKELRALLHAETAAPLGANDLTRLLSAAPISAYHSVGMRATRAGQARMASYRMLAGKRVEGAVSATEAVGTSLGHVMARAQGGRGSGTFGYSVQKSKLWEPDAADSILAYRDWCVSCSDDLATATSANGLPGLDIPLADRFSAFPDNPIAALLDYRLIDGAIPLRSGADDVVGAELEIIPTLVAGELRLEVWRGATLVWEGTQLRTGDIRAGSTVELSGVDPSTGEIVEFAGLLELVPATVFFGDGSSIQGGWLTPAPQQLPDLAPDAVDPWDWAGVETTSEFSDDPDRLTVMRHIEGIAGSLGTWSIRDHGSGEIADVIAIEDTAQGVTVTLFHCKSASSTSAQSRVDDLYEVLGQAIRSVRWVAQGPVFWEQIDQRLESRSFTIILSGDGAGLRAAIKEWAQQPPLTEFHIVAVQPGITAASTTRSPSVHGLLVSTHSWCHGQGAVFRLMCRN